MSSSLPRLRTLSEQNANNQGKFKKLKLGTQASIVSSLSKRQHSTQRLMSLQRYSSIQQQRDARNEKIQLNLMERKLLGGRYDQTLETGNDLTRLKGRADQFKTQAKSRLEQTQKVRRYLNDVKKQIAQYNKKAKQHQNELKKLQQKVQTHQKNVEIAKAQKSIYENMLENRNHIILHFSKQNSEGKKYLEKLKTFNQLFDKQLRQTTQKLKILEKAHQQIQDKLETQRSQRQQLVIYKQNVISSRVCTQLQRQGKNKKYFEIVQQIQQQQKNKSFHSVYDKILASMFLRQFLEKSFLIIQTKYAQIDKSYRNIQQCSSVPFKEPKNMTQRFAKLQPQKASLQQNIKQRESLIRKLQEKHKTLEKQLEIKTIQGMQTTQYSSFDLINQSLKKINLDTNIEEIATITLQNKKIQQNIGKFASDGLNRLGLKQQKGYGNTTIMKNFKSLVQTIMKEIKLLQQKQKVMKQQKIE